MLSTVAAEIAQLRRIVPINEQTSDRISSARAEDRAAAGRQGLELCWRAHAESNARDAAEEHRTHRRVSKTIHAR